MWRVWGKSSPRIHNNSSSTATDTVSSPSFRCKSFKDIQNLCSSDDDSSPFYYGIIHHDQENQSQQQPLSPSIHRKASVFHRVRTAKSILRQWSPKLDDPTTTTKPDYDHHSQSQPSPTLLPVSPPKSGSQSQPPNDTDPASQLNPTTASPPDVHGRPQIYLPGAETRIVVYYSSLRVIRPTFEAYKTVQSILHGFRVTVDERDLSMDAKLRDELCSILGCTKEKLTVPKVFVGGRYVGGAEEVKQMHEVGELKRLVEGLKLDSVNEKETNGGGGEGSGVCAMCVGYRFVVCSECSGSRKVFSEKGGGGFKACTTCNENGLIRCPDCFKFPVILSSSSSSSSCSPTNEG